MSPQHSSVESVQQIFCLPAASQVQMWLGSSMAGDSRQVEVLAKEETEGDAEQAPAKHEQAGGDRLEMSKYDDIRKEL